MARRDTTPQDDEKRSYGALWLVLSVLLFIGALWAIADHNFFRRPWKKGQGGLQPGRDQPYRGPDRRRAGTARSRSEVPGARQAARRGAHRGILGRHGQGDRASRARAERRGAPGPEQGPQPALRQERDGGAA